MPLIPLMAASTDVAAAVSLTATSTLTVGSAVPVFVGVTHADYTAATVNTAQSVVLPTGTAQGDLILLFVSFGTTGTTLTGPGAGWNTVGNPMGGSDQYTALWWKIAGASEPAPTFASSDLKAVVTCASYRNADPTTPLDVTPLFLDDPAAATHPVPAPNVSDGALLVSYVSMDGTTGAVIPQYTAPAGWTKRLDAENNTSDNYVQGLADLGPVSAGTKSGYTWGTVYADRAVNVVSLAVRAPGATPPAQPGAAALTASSTLSAGATPERPAAVAMAASSTLSASPVREQAAAAALSATATLTAGVTGEQAVTAALSATATLTVAAATAQSAAAAMSATSTLMANPVGNIVHIATVGSTSHRSNSVWSPPMPTHQAGDLLIAFHAVGSSVETVTYAAGWTHVDRANSVSGVGDSFLWKIATSSAEQFTSLTASSATARENAVVIGCYRGVDVDVPIKAYTKTEQTSVSTHTSTALGALSGAFLELSFVSEHPPAAGATNTTWTPPAGITKRAEAINPSTVNQQSSIAIGDAGALTTGSAPSRGWGSTIAANGSAWSVALTPSTSAVPTRAGTAALTATSTLTTAGVIDRPPAAAMTATATLNSDGTIPPGSGTVTHVASVGSSSRITAPTVFTPTMPTHQAGDLLIVLHGVGSSTETLTFAAGWNVVARETGASGVGDTLLWKIATSATEQFTALAGSTTTARIHAATVTCLRGAHSVTPLSGTARVVETATATHTAPTLAVTGPFYELTMVTDHAVANATANTGWTPPAGTTLLAQGLNSSILNQQSTVAVGATGVMRSDGSIPARAWTSSIAANGSAWSIAVNPSGTTPPPAVPALGRRVNGPDSIKTVTTNATSARLRIGTDSAVTTGLVYSAAVTPDVDGNAEHVTSGLGLAAGTQYYYRVEMTDSGGGTSLDTGAVGSFKTAPVGPTSFAFSFSACCNAADSAAMAAVAARADDLFFHLGDLYYADASGTSVANYRAKMGAKLDAPNHAAVFSTRTTFYTPSDHDSAMNNNGTGGTAPAALASFNQVYREYIPAPVPANGVYYSKAWGRIRFVNLDTRTFKSNPADADTSAKTALGATQKAWLFDLVQNCAEPVIVIAQEAPWIGAATAGDDAWLGYSTERTEVANTLAATGKKIVLLAGDMHALGFDSGVNSPGGFPVMHAAPLNNTSSQKGGPYSGGTYPTGSGTAAQQYGRVVVTDTGSNITLAFTGYDSGDVARVTGTVTVSTVAATATLSATATLTAGGTRDTASAAALSAASTLTTGATRERPASVTLAATSTLTTGATRTGVVAAALSGASTLSAGATREVPGAAGLTAASTLTVAATRERPATVAMAASSTLTAGATPDRAGAAALAATATLTTGAIREVPAAAALSAASTLTAGATREQPAAAALSAASTLTATATREQPAAAALSAASTLTAAATSTGAVAAAAALIASSTLTTAATREQPGAVALTGTATLSTTATRVVPAAVALAATSTLTAAATREVPTTVALAATGTLTTGATREQGATVSLAATSTLTAAATREQAATVSLAAAATLTTSAVRGQPAATAMAATSALTTGATREQPTAAALTATSTLSALPTGAAPAAAALTAVATLTTTGTREVPAAAALTGAATLTVGATRAVPAAAALAATGTLTTAAVREQPAAVAMTGAATLSTTGTYGVAGAAALTAVATLTTAAVPDRPATAALTATGTLTTGVFGAVSAAAALTAASTLSVSAVPTRVAAAALTGASTLTTGATRGQPATVALTATGAFTTGATREQPAVVAMTATATLGAAATRERPAAAALSAASTLTTAATGGTPAAAALTAAATLTTSAARTAVAAAALTATSTLAANATVAGLQPGAAALSAAATLTTAGVPDRPTAAAMAASSTLATGAVRVVPGVVTLVASSALSVAVVPVRTGAVALVAAATLDTAPLRGVPATVTLTAAATLTTAAIRERPALVALTAVAVLTSLAERIREAVVVLEADAVLTVGVESSTPGAAALAASSTLTTIPVYDAFAGWGIPL